MNHRLLTLGILLLCACLQGQSLPLPGPGMAASGGAAAPTMVASRSAQDLSGNTFTALASSSAVATTTGWTSVVACMTSDSTVTHTAPTDTAGTTYTELTTARISHADFGKISLWSATNITGHAANIATCHWGSSAYDAILNFYVANAASSASVHVQFTSTQQSGTTITSNSFSTTVPNTLLFACLPSETGSSTFLTPLFGGSAGTLMTTGASNAGQLGCAWRAVTATQTGITAALSSSSFCSNCKISGGAIK